MRLRLPRLPTAAATAERLPFRDESLDAITVAQAFHWFDARAALAEFHRVLRPGGRLALVWNARDRSVPWVDEVWSIMDRVEKRAPWRAHDEWRDSAFVDTPWFGPLHEATFHHEQMLSPTDVVERVRSVSHVAVLPPDQRESVLDEVRALLRDDPATAGRETLALPYRVDAYWAERT
jgi:SAM-dependent methyltransferase